MRPRITLPSAVKVGANQFTDNNREYAVSFRTGNTTSHYTLNSVKIKIYDKVGSPGNIQVALYSVSGGNPGTKLQDLTGTDKPGPERDNHHLHV